MLKNLCDEEDEESSFIVKCSWALTHILMMKTMTRFWSFLSFMLQARHD